MRSENNVNVGKQIILGSDLYQYSRQKKSEDWMSPAAELRRGSCAF